MNNLLKLLVLIQCLFISQITQAQSTHFSYQDMGQGQPLILIHAFPSDHRLWMPQQEGLKKHFRVITLDLYGFGQAKKTDGNAVTMDEYANEVKKLMDELQIPKAIVGGESMGGYVALAFLKKYPDSLNGLILSDTQAIADSAETKAKREAAAIDVLDHGASQFIESFLPKALSSHASQEVSEYLKNILVEQSEFGIASALRGMALREDSSDTLSKTKLPVLIITGELDTLISPQQSEKMHELVKQSHLVMIQNAGHLSSLEQPDEWNKAVIENL